MTSTDHEKEVWFSISNILSSGLGFGYYDWVCEREREREREREKRDKIEVGARRSQGTYKSMLVFLFLYF